MADTKQTKQTEMPGDWNPFYGRPPCAKRGDLECLRDCEFGMVGPCERERTKDWEDQHDR